MDSSAWLKAGEVIFGGALGGTAAVFGLSRWLRCVAWEALGLCIGGPELVRQFPNVFS